LHFRCTAMLNKYILQSPKISDCAARWTLGISDGICKISLLPERGLYQSFVHPTRLTWSIVPAISMPGHWISQSVIFEKLSTIHLRYMPGSLLDWSNVHHKVHQIPTRHSILQYELGNPHYGILT
jgi:hypothetical protein